MQPSDTCPIEIPNFRILSLLGQGGMGRVFLAEQIQPARKVVIKVVEPEAIRVSDADIRHRIIDRLQHEGDIAARFAHPNLVTVFQCGVIDGHYYLAMEYLAGGDLRQRLDQPLAPSDAAAICARIASGLEQMHRAGLLHRDLKPENILLRDNGEPVLVDFGIARDPDHPSGLTDLGVRSGTVQYMSPEQLSRGVTDARSDLYALGIVFYELLTGRVPFDGGTSSDIQQAHMETPVPRLPEELADYQPLVDALLAKDPEDRFQSAQDVSNALMLHAPTEPSVAVRIPSRNSGFETRRRRFRGWWLPVGAALVLATAAGIGWFLGQRPPAAEAGHTETTEQRPSLGSVAVLPFVNLSGDPGMEYISDGISEEVLNTLAQLNSLRVAARSSSFQFKGRNADATTVGQQLRVGHVLEGSVRAQGQTIRVTAQLIDAESGFHRWSATFDRELNDLFAIQYEIARAVAEAIEPRLLGDLRPGVSTDEVEAYDLYLLGRHYYLKRNRQSLERARELFSKATDSDPGYALAWIGLANATILLLDSPATYGSLPLSEVNAEATAAHENAARSTPDLAELHASRGLLQIVNGNHEEAVRHLSRALAINANLAVAYMWRGTTQGFLGRFDRCLADLQTAYEIDPLSAAVLSNLVWANHLAGEPELTENYIETVLRRHPEFLLAWGNSGNVRYMQGRLEEARLLYLHAYEASPSYRLARRMLGIIELDRGHLGRAGELLSGADLAWPLVAAGRVQEAWPLVRDAGSGDLDTRTYVAAADRRFGFIVDLFNQMVDDDGRLPGGLTNASQISNLGRLPALTVAHALSQTGESNRARAVLQAAESIIAQGRNAGASTPGMLYADAVLSALRGEHDAALKGLQSAVSGGWKSWWYMANDPRLESLHEDDRFGRLVESIRPATLVAATGTPLQP